jgi:hypothetical protein
MRKSELTVTIKGGSSVDKADIADCLYEILKEVGFKQVEIVKHKSIVAPLTIVRDMAKIIVE